MLPLPLTGRCRRCTGWPSQGHLARTGPGLQAPKRPLFPSIYAWQTVVYDQSEAPLTVEQVMDSRGRVNRHLAWNQLSSGSRGCAT